MLHQVPLHAAPVAMVELSTKVSRTLNKTTPGIQIWRIEVGMGSLLTRALTTGLFGVAAGGKVPPLCPQCMGLGLGAVGCTEMG